MGLKLSVKIGDVTNLSDARYAAGMGVDYIGFNIDTESDNNVTAQKFNEITNWISGVGIIGEIGANSPTNKEEYPSYITESTDITQLREESVLRIKAKELSFNEISKLLESGSNVLFFILDLSTSQIESDITELTELCAKWPIYISADFNNEILEKIVGDVKPKGIEIKGGIEDQPGFKDYDGIADVLEWLEEDE
ncbi:MAG: hypothetical protein L3J29_11665 [Cyclobacteriaceae bacterium]|nr:hypothetical protein [Cyclobacteriaceae bacterium]